MRFHSTVLGNANTCFVRIFPTKLKSEEMLNRLKLTQVAESCGNGSSLIQ